MGSGNTIYWKKKQHHGRYQRSHSRSISPDLRQKRCNRRIPTRHRGRSRSPQYDQTKGYCSPHHRNRSIGSTHYRSKDSLCRSRSRSPALRNRSSIQVNAKHRSHNQDQPHNRSHSISRSRSRSHSIGRPRSRSHSISRSQSRSCSISRSQSRSDSTDTPQSRSDSTDTLRSISHSLGKPRSRSRSTDRFPIRSHRSEKDHRSIKSPARYRSKSPAYFRSKSPACYRSKSPARYRRKIPAHCRSISPARYRSKDPAHHRSKSPARGRSKSPTRYQSKSPAYYRSKSPARHRSKSQDRYRSKSPARYRSKSPAHYRSKSPVRHRSKSPARYQSKSPACYRSKSPARDRSKSRSPIQLKRESGSSSRLQSRNNTPTNPRARGRRDHLRSRSQSLTRQSRSRSITRLDNRSCNTSKLRSTSTSSSGSQCSHRRSAESQNKSETSDCHESKNRSPSQERGRSNSILREKQVDLNYIYAALDEEAGFLSGLRNWQDEPEADKLDFSRLESRITRTMKKMCQTATDKIINNTPSKQKNSNESLSSDENIEDSVRLGLEEVGEDVFDMFDKPTISNINDSAEAALKEGLQSGKRRKEFEAGSNPSPPKQSQGSGNTDKDPSKLMQEKIEVLMGPPNLRTSGRNSIDSSFWTPLLDHPPMQESKMNMTCQERGNEWEVETPYIGRKEKPEVQDDAMSGREITNLKSVTITEFPHPEPVISNEKGNLNDINQDQHAEQLSQSKNILYPREQSPSVDASSAVPQTRSHVIMPTISSSSASASTFEAATFSTPLTQPADHEEECTKANSSCSSPEAGGTSTKKASVEHKARKPSESPRRSKYKRHRERRNKHKRSSSDSESQSDKSDHKKLKVRKKSPQTKRDKNDGKILFLKRESLIKQVKMLLEQKNMMNEKRDDIIKNHKGSQRNLSNLLEENSLLMSEIGQQILKINNMVLKVNQEIKAKRGDIKQKPKLMSEEKYENPYYSREKKFHRSLERAELNLSSLRKYKKTRSNKPSVSVEQSQQKQFRSPLKLSKENKSVSPDPGLSKDSKIYLSTPKSVKNESLTKSFKENTEKKQASHLGRSQPESAKEELDKSSPQALISSQRSYIRYMDRGMHWCKLCNVFCESIPEYVSHLMTPFHFTRLKKRKT